jgi:hypothetical protein
MPEIEIIYFICLGLTLVTGFMPLSLPAQTLGVMVWCFVLVVAGMHFHSPLMVGICAFFGYLRYLKLCRLQEAYELVQVNQEKDHG